jgi:IS1 family transposase/transposase-like protein
MVIQKIKCLHCNSEDISKRGTTKEGKQRYACNNDKCVINSFILDYTYKGCLPNIKSQIIEMAMNSSGIRDTARVLKISPVTVIKELKKKNSISKINLKELENLKNLNDVKVDIVKVIDVEADEMWSYVGNKKNQYWLWHAIDHNTGKVLAYTLGRREEKVFAELKKLLSPFNINIYYTDGAKVYSRYIDGEKHIIGKKNTQKIERKHLNFRTRIKRLASKTICFSKSVIMHEIVVGMFINITEFGLVI